MEKDVYHIRRDDLKEEHSVSWGDTKNNLEKTRKVRWYSEEGEIYGYHDPNNPEASEYGYTD